MDYSQLIEKAAELEQKRVVLNAQLKTASENADSDDNWDLYHKLDEEQRTTKILLACIYQDMADIEAAAIPEIGETGQPTVLGITSIASEEAVLKQ